MNHSSHWWYVYVLVSLQKNYIYIGSTGNLELRINEHHSGNVQSTKAYRPLKLMAYVAVNTEGRARRLEKYFKTGSGKAILRKRILGDEAPPTSPLDPTGGGA